MPLLGPNSFRSATLEADKVVIRTCHCGCGNLHLILRYGTRQVLAIVDRDEALMIAQELKKAADKLPAAAGEGSLQ